MDMACNGASGQDWYHLSWVDLLRRCHNRSYRADEQDMRAQYRVAAGYDGTSAALERRQPANTAAIGN
ncbi:hypothetical protein MAPG_02520 [Magnaporthiopsis poae ATCC 64411]|uniref:Uncharacterized protein n=1 Tax=Magnaporthiopsis poae (strain ATCC 64411 / 73-15) TaxID=644358 RepID=A0A0C4DRK8_MAGP6|nr:hypothetical protein MAPG_02520 [Magnaporthiopsis poae ATCC 64411]